MKEYLLLSLIAFSMSVSALEQNQHTQAIDAIFKKWDKPNVPGASVGVIKDGKLLYSNSYGMADLEHGIGLTSKSVFNIGSVSKQFVTFSLLLLEEQGQIDLDAKVQKYLPNFPEYNQTLTIRDFIHHTSGVRDYLTLMHLKGKNHLDHTEISEAYNLIKRQEKLNFSPGEKFSYSNSGYLLLGMIIEKAAGQSLKVFADENIFKPLGMGSTVFYDDNTDLIKNRVFSYNMKKNHNNEEMFINLISRRDLVGDGGVYTNMEDLYLWDQNFYNNKLGKGGQGIIDKMHDEGLLSSGESSGYAFGLIHGTYKGLSTVHHEGKSSGFRSQLMRFPEENISVIVLANRDDANTTHLSYQIADILLKDAFVKETKVTEKFSLTQLTGLYKNAAGANLKITLKNGLLYVLQSWNQTEYDIRNTSGNTYDIPVNTSREFVFSSLQDNATQILTVLHDGILESTFKRTNTRRRLIYPSVVNLKDFVGNYYSKDLDVDYVIFVKNNSLKVKIANYDSQELIQYNEEDTFMFGTDFIRFERSNEGITGLEINAARETNLKLVKK